MLYQVVLIFESVDEILKCGHLIQVKATEQYFLVVLFIMLNTVVLTFEPANEIQVKVTKQYYPVVPCCLSCCTKWF